MNKRWLRILTYVIMVYMLLAFAWWAMLLFTKNRDAFLAKAELQKIVMVAQGLVKSEEDFYNSENYQELKAAYRRQEWMILGEGLVFLITLSTGIWFINASYHREIKANEQRRNFLLAITHELKSPIASIQLVLETLLKRELPREKEVEFLKAASEENERLKGLVENLLFSAKLENSYEPDFEELNLSELARQIVESIKVRYRDVQLSLEESGDLPLIRADRAGITSVLYNLIENAVKYSGEEPEVTVHLSTQSGDEVIVSVADNGPGIPEGERNNIFQKFYRIGSEETRRTKGTGLGLFIVDQVVRAHGGHIEVLPNQPTGTIFRITLPARTHA